MIKATIVQDSISPEGVRLTTFELEYPRFIHSEFMTHRMISKNSASSRAIPVAKMIEHIEANYARPIHWGKNQAGMQAKEELTGDDLRTIQGLWHMACWDAIRNAKAMLKYGAHKQIVNRILEPFMTMKVVATATDWENFFWLRDHEDAQPEIAQLARLMRVAMDSSEPMQLRYGEWHVPYVDRQVSNKNRELEYFSDGQRISVKDALMLSASLCAQVSYRKSDDSLEKAQDIFKRLIESKPCHASPTEHQARCENGRYLLPGYTAENCKYGFYSGNFRAWIQHRQLLKDHTRYG